MQNSFCRTEMIFGQEAMRKLASCHVAVFGVGGVGGYVVEALVRSGIGKITIVDNDTVARSNINRQIIATEETIAKDKVDVAMERILQINPNTTVIKYKTFFLPENSNCFDFLNFYLIFL